MTGHRTNNAAFAQSHAGIESVLETIFATIDQAVAATPLTVEGMCVARSRLHSMLADGTDRLAVDKARKHDWEIVAPLPFGLPLLAAIVAEPGTLEETDAALAYAQLKIAGAHLDGVVLSERMKLAIDPLVDVALNATRFELAERDERTLSLLRQVASGDSEAMASFAAEASYRYALASRIIVEQSDILISVWDGTSRTQFGGTGHTTAVALEAGLPVVLVPAQDPANWCILHAPEALSGRRGALLESDERRRLADLVSKMISPGQTSVDKGLSAFLRERWRWRSNAMWNGYRRVETLFGEVDGQSAFRSLVQHYEVPSETAKGSWGSLFTKAATMPGITAGFLSRLEVAIAQRFAWADGLATHLSDAYRGGMVLNFVLSAFAITIGLAYLPYATAHEKWIFATIELVTLFVILVVTAYGRRLRWHARWFEGRRVAEYLRHGPVLLLLGVSRSAGRWPRGVSTSWPEWYARQSLREVGLPALAVTQAFLREALVKVLRPHVVAQRDYHFEKARRLSAVHHNLDRVSSRLFQLALVVVATYVGLKVLTLLPGAPEILGPSSSYHFTFYGVILPMLGATVAGIRYFGDFERFAGISEVAAEKLEAAATRIDQLLAGGEDDIDYESVSRIAHAVDDCVVDEIESWQSVFRGKEITIPG
ncbi:MAG: hypothetical protein ABL973_15545 [Micropepsaceae bacterium]